MTAQNTTFHARARAWAVLATSIAGFGIYSMLAIMNYMLTVVLIPSYLRCWHPVNRIHPCKVSCRNHRKKPIT